MLSNLWCLSTISSSTVRSHSSNVLPPPLYHKGLDESAVAALGPRVAASGLSEYSRSREALQVALGSASVAVIAPDDGASEFPGPDAELVAAVAGEE